MYAVYTCWGKSSSWAPSSSYTLTLVVSTAIAKCTVQQKLTSLPLVPCLLARTPHQLTLPPLVPLPLIPPWYHIHQYHTHQYHFHNCPIQIVMVYNICLGQQNITMLLLALLDLGPRVLLVAEKRRKVDVLLCNNRLQ